MTKQFKELTFEEFCKYTLTYTMGLRYDWGAHRVYRDEQLGIQQEIITKQKVKGDIYSGWKDPLVVFYLDNDDRVFTTLDQLYVAYMEKVCNIKDTK